jgi:hypothetical protein
MEQSSSCEDDSCSISQEADGVLSRQNVHYYVHKILLFLLIVSQMKPIYGLHTLIPWS